MSRRWTDLGGSPYNLETFYQPMKWPNNLTIADAQVFPARFGGPVALVFGMRESASNCLISLHTASGMKYGQIQWRRGALHSLVWTTGEDLLCVQSDGQVYVFDLFGVEKKHKQFTMGKECCTLGIVSCVSFVSPSGVTGIAVLHSEHRFFVVNDYNNPKVWRAADLQRKAEEPSCWTVYCGVGGNVTVLCVVRAEVYFVQQNKQPEQLMVETEAVQFIACSVSASGHKLGVLSENGVVQVFKLDTYNPLCLTNLDSHVRQTPTYFMWCGSEALALYDRQTVTLISSNTCDIARFAFDDECFLCEEVDGVRIYNQSSHKFLCKVAEAIVQVLRVASDAPGAYLWAAQESYDKMSCEAYDLIKMAGGGLSLGVQQCIEAACHHLDTTTQKQLLTAASLGKCLCVSGEVGRNELANAARLLRALNAVRVKHFALALTWQQTTILTVPVLLNRLILRKQWPLALSVAEYLKLPKEQGVHRVLTHWANSKIVEERSKCGSDRLPAEVLCESLCRKLSEHPGISYADVAERAADEGLKQLATLLLEHEHQLIKQVNMLLKLGQDAKALHTAANSADPDLMSHVVLNMKQTLDWCALGLALNKFPPALNLYKAYCRQEAPNHFVAVCTQQDDFVNMAHAALAQADQATVFEVREKQEQILLASKHLLDGKETFFSNAAAERAKLVKFQNGLEQTFASSGQPFVDISLRDTIIWLEENGHKTNAEACRKQFNISNKQYWYWKIEGLARAAKDAELLAFSKHKKSPIGVLPFIELFMKYGGDSNCEAVSFWQSKLPQEEQVRGLLLTKDLLSAAQRAFDLGDIGGLEAVQSQCTPADKNVTDKINSLKNSLINK